MDLSLIEDSYPLSPIQQGMLFNSLYTSQSSVDVEQIVCRLNEQLEASLFEKSWNRLIDRHPILRTAFRWVGLQEPLQDVYRDVQVPLNQLDWSGFSEEEQNKQLKEFLADDRRRGFVLSEVPLMRLNLFVLAEDRYIFIWTFHHTLLDGRSFTLLLQELFKIYEAYWQGEEIQLDTPRPFRDHIDFLQQMDLVEMESFWRNKLVQFTEPVSMPDLWVERFEKEAGVHHQEEAAKLPKEITSRLKQLAKEHNLTINTFVQGAWAILLSRYCRVEDVVFGATRACRYSTVSGAENMVGCFINTVPVRIFVDPDKSLIPWLTELREQWVEMRPYEQAPLANVQQLSDIPKGMQLFESILVFENYLMNTMLRNQGGAWLNREFEVLEQTNFPLTVAAYLDEELGVKIEYDPGYFDERIIRRMAGHVIELLESMVKYSDRCVGNLRMSTNKERQKLLFFWNETDAPAPPIQYYHSLFEEQAAKTPDAPAVEFMGEILSYKELNRRANQLAHYLITLGVGPDSIVGICMDRSLELAVGLIGIFKAGGAYLPLDPSYPQDRLEYMLEDSEAKVVLIRDHLRETIPPSIDHTICLDTQWNLVDNRPQENPISETASDNLAYLIYTSGTTGKPKGVMIPHYQLISHNLATIRLFDLQPKDRALQFASISFDIAGEEFFPTWLSGACLVLRTDEMASNISKFIERCEATDITILNLPTAFWHELVRGLEETGANIPATVRLVIVGGEKASAPAYQKWKKLVPDTVRWLNSYGPTEATVTATSFDPIRSSWVAGRHKEIPIGRPLDNTLAYILDPFIHPVPVGVPGELHIGGFGVGRGYLNRNDLTQEKFITDPFMGEGQQKMYKTGDLVRYLENGDIEFLGRTDHQVKIRGFRIELGEIESVIAEFGSVHETVVLAREDKPGEKKLVAYLLPTPGPKPDVGELLGFLRKRLPAYMVPAAAIIMESFPKTPGGKINRNRLPAPEYNDSDERTGRVVPPTLPIEVELVEIWEELLGVKPIGITDNFFEMGGDSLLAVRLFTRIEQEYERTLPLATLLRVPTIQELGLVIRQGGMSDPWSSLVEIQPQGAKSPLFCMHGIGGDVLIYWELAHRLGQNQPTYGLQMQGLYEGQQPHESVAECAAFYIKELKEIQPQGPYYLCGYSSGGIMAYEMAQQLMTEGEKVALLAMIDTNPSEEQGLGKKIRNPRYVWGFLKNLPYWIQDLSRRSPRKLVSDVARKCDIGIKKVTEMLRPQGSTEKDVDLANVMDGNVEGLSDQRQVAMQVHYQALVSYEPKMYSGRIDMFRSRRQPLFGFHDEKLGWGDLIEGQMDVKHINGPHFQIMAPPYVDELADIFKKQLNKAQLEAEG